MSVASNSANNHTHGGTEQFYANQQLPPVMIDEKIVLKQKEKALKELESRVKLALAQHNQMYQLQRAHIVAEHDRQVQLARSAIEDEKAASVMALEQAFQQNTRSIDHAAQTQRIAIEQQANLLELHSIQQQMAMQHAERERQWAASYATAAPALIAALTYQSLSQGSAQPLFSLPQFSTQVSQPNSAKVEKAQ